jgi:hydroxymethylglutaryl-CoA lyase
MSDLVKIVECPRDAWQGLPVKMAAEVKADYLRALVAAGFRHIDAVSFVSASVVPQMSDSEKVLEFLFPLGIGEEIKDNSRSSAARRMTSSQEMTNSEGMAGLEMDDVEIIGIVVNAKGADRAVKTGRVSTLGFPYSVSPGFLQRNQNQTPEESLEALEAVGEIAYKAGMDVVAYISMAFGNPYGEYWDIEEIVAACDLLVDSGVRQISLADTVGLATPKLVADVMSDVIAVHGGDGGVEIGVHLHARYDEAEAKVKAAYGAGCRRFDAAIGGLGGCPMAQDALVGNIATEVLVKVLQEMGAEVPEIVGMDALVKASEEIGRKFGGRVQ